MKSWFKFYEKCDEKVQQLVRQIPWGHNIAIVNKVHDIETVVFYAGQSLENGWSRSVLIHQIETQLHQRIGSKTNNFQVTLPKPQSDLAEQTLKDPYIFEF